MNAMLLNRMVDISTIPKLSDAFPNRPKYWLLVLLGLVLTFICCLDSHGASRIPGVDASNQLEAAGTLLRMVDTALFIWGARIFAGIAILSAGWNLKEQRFGVAIICVVSALIFGTAPIWVKNIFDIGGGNGIFS